MVAEVVWRAHSHELSVHLRGNLRQVWAHDPIGVQARYLVIGLYSLRTAKAYQKSQAQGLWHTALRCNYDCPTRYFLCTAEKQHHQSQVRCLA